MVLVIKEVKPPISIEEIGRIVEITNSIIITDGLKEPIVEYIVIIKCEKIGRYCKEKQLIEVSEKCCIGHSSIVICGDVLANVFIEEIMRALYAISMIETYGSVCREKVDAFVKEKFMSVLVHFKNQK